MGTEFITELAVRVLPNSRYSALTDFKGISRLPAVRACLASASLYIVKVEVINDFQLASCRQTSIFNSSA